MCGLFSLGVAGFRGLTDAEELAYGPVAESEQFEIVFNDEWQ